MKQLLELRYQKEPSRNAFGRDNGQKYSSVSYDLKKSDRSQADKRNVHIMQLKLTPIGRLRVGNRDAKRCSMIQGIRRQNYLQVNISRLLNRYSHSLYHNGNVNPANPGVMKHTTFSTAAAKDFLLLLGKKADLVSSSVSYLNHKRCSRRPHGVEQPQTLMCEYPPILNSHQPRLVVRSSHKPHNYSDQSFRLPQRIRYKQAHTTLTQSETGTTPNFNMKAGEPQRHHHSAYEEQGVQTGTEIDILQDWTRTIDHNTRRAPSRNHPRTSNSYTLFNNPILHNLRD